MSWFNKIYEAADPGTWFDTGAEDKLNALRKDIPQTPDYSPYFEQLRGRMAQAGRPGEGFQGTDYYRALQSDVDQSARKLGQATGQRLTDAGVAGSSTSGPAMRAAGENTEIVGRLRLGATAQAQQQKASQDVQYFDQLLRGAGFEKGIGDTRFMQEYQIFLAKQGLTQAQIQAQVDEMNMWLGLIGQGAGAAATAYAGGAGAA